MEGVEVATKEVTKELENQNEMLENTQREWANLIYDLFSDGNAHDIGDFFDTIAKGFARMVAEMAAADLAAAVFGGKGGNLSSLLGGLGNGSFDFSTGGTGGTGGYGGAGGSGGTAGSAGTGGTGGTACIPDSPPGAPPEPPFCDPAELNFDCCGYPDSYCDTVTNQCISLT